MTTTVLDAAIQHLYGLDPNARYAGPYRYAQIAVAATILEISDLPEQMIEKTGQALETHLRGQDKNSERMFVWNVEWLYELNKNDTAAFRQVAAEFCRANLVQLYEKEPYRSLLKRLPELMEEILEHVVSEERRSAQANKRRWIELDGGSD